MPKWLDRIWLVLIALSFCIAAPIWFILMFQRLGYEYVLFFVTAAFVVRWFNNRRKREEDTGLRP